MEPPSPPLVPYGLQPAPSAASNMLTGSRAAPSQQVCGGLRPPLPGGFGLETCMDAFVYYCGGFGCRRGRSALRVVEVRCRSSTTAWGRATPGFFWHIAWRCCLRSCCSCTWWPPSAALLHRRQTQAFSPPCGGRLPGTLASFCLQLCRCL